MKKVLIITYYWPPSGGSGVQRWLNFAKYLPKLGWQPIIYTVENGEFPVLDETLLNEIPKNLIVIKKPIWEPFNLYKRFIGQKKIEKFGHAFTSDKKTGGFKKKLQSLAVYIRGNYFIPDARKYFIKPSVIFLENYIKENKITHIITSGPPHSMHLIGLDLKKKLPITWLADFRDPWTGVYYFKDLKLSTNALNKHLALEKSVLQNADKIISVGKNLKLNLLKLAGKEAVENKFAVISNGHDGLINITNKQPDLFFFTLVYTGLFSKDQNHNALWQAVGELKKENIFFSEKLKIHCYGKIDASIIQSISNNDLSHNLISYDYMPLNEIRDIQRNAALLLLCINHYPAEKEILTGKLFDYICSGRPILNVGPTDGDAADIINDTQTGKTFLRTDKEGIKLFLKTAFEEFEKGKLCINFVNLNKYSREELTAKLADLLSSK